MMHKKKMNGPKQQTIVAVNRPLHFTGVSQVSVLSCLLGGPRPCCSSIVSDERDDLRSEQRSQIETAAFTLGLLC